MAVGEEVIVFNDVATSGPVEGSTTTPTGWPWLDHWESHKAKTKIKQKDMKVLWGLDGNGREKRQSGDECDYCVLYTCTSLPKDS